MSKMTLISEINKLKTKTILDSLIQSIKKLKKEKKKIVFLLDHDGSLADTNGVKDEHLGDFTRGIWGEHDKEGNKVTDETLNKIHRDMHGQPMGVIFQRIAKEVYSKEISKKKGEKVTDQLNKYIKPYYSKKDEFEGSTEFLKLCNILGDVYILTGMESYMVKESLKEHKWENLVKGIYGAPNNKDENIKLIKEKYQEDDVTYVCTGDAKSERNAAKNAGIPYFIKINFDGKSPYKNDPEAVSNSQQLIAKTLEAYLKQI